jgi:hypothetical protein
MISMVYILGSLFGSSILSPALILLFVIVDATIIEAAHSFFHEDLIEE